MSWQDDYQRKLVSLKEAAAQVKSGDNLGLSAGPSCPTDLMNAIADRYEELEDVSVVSGILMSGLKHLEGKYRGHINHHTIFLGPLERMFFGQGNIESTSYNFSLTDYLFTERLNCNVGIVECSPPDERGYMSFGPLGTFSNDIAGKTADKIIVQVNSRTPYVYGTQAHLHVSDADFICEHDHELPEIPEIPTGDAENKIAEYIVERIDDGSTIQIGLGKLANAIGFLLENKKDLGVHTEMITDSMVELAKKGVINGSRKSFHPGKMVCGFGIGSRDLYDFMDHNPMLEVRPIAYINDIRNLARLDNFVSINNALAVDLTGQVCSETLGFNAYSGTGGQLDFVRGAALSNGGKSFIALKSVANTKNGMISRITNVLDPGTVVSTPRSDVQYIVTEWGVADLYCKSIEQRVKGLISIAHPDFRDQLAREAVESGLLRSEEASYGKLEAM